MTTGADVVAPLLQARGVCKDYPGVRALWKVDFTLRAGEVVALVGENGAGKSTLMKALAGVVQPDDGQILLDGAPVRLAGPADALRAGIALIHQELSLCDNLTVAGALFLGAELRRGPFLRLGAMRAQAATRPACPRRSRRARSSCSRSPGPCVRRRAC